MSRVVYLESVAGVAGDMFAAAFLDAGLVTAAELAALPAQLGFSATKIEVTSVVRATMRATHLRVAVSPGTDPTPLGHAHALPAGSAAATHGHDETETHLVIDPTAGHLHTHYVDIDRRLHDSSLAPAVRELARKIFRLLAEAEAEAHGGDVTQVAFHEVGSIDSIVDVAMAAFCAVKVSPARLVASPIRPGRGFIRIAHGQQPVPPPASARLLIGLPVAGTPAEIRRENVELSTPTGIAILKALAPEFLEQLPSGTVISQGMGAGTMELGAFPNVFRVFLVEETPRAVGALPYESDRIVELSCNIDDDTGEHLAWLAEQLLAAGALDVSLLPGTGKKSRPIVLLSVLAREDQWSQLADWLLKHSTTFGVRHRVWDRLKLARKFEPRETRGRTVTYKIGLTTDGKVLKEKAEFDEQRKLWEDPEAKSR